MKLASFALAAFASLGLAGTASAHPPAYVRPAPSVSFGVVTPGGFSFGYNNFNNYGYSNYYRPNYGYGYGNGYGYNRGHYHYTPGYFAPHGNHYHYIPGHGHYHRR